jgi:hypothetical protein
MRLPRDAIVFCALAACAGSGTTAAADPATSAPPAAVGNAVSADEVRAAAERLRSDPDLGGEHHIRSLRWTRSGAADPPRGAPAWIQGLFEYLGQTARLLMWAAGSIMTAVAVLWAYRTFKARTPAPALMAAPTIARVGDLDIRPESLPANIGDAALALAERGKTREALSLLYRGALSRAVHRFGVPIGESYTEGEALRAVGAVLDAARISYFSDLIGIRRRAVYAGEPTAAQSVKDLCRGFAATLDAETLDAAALDAVAR